MDSITRDNLEEKLKTFVTRRNKIREQLNEAIVLVQKLEGAIEAIELLLKELDKVDIEANKE